MVGVLVGARPGTVTTGDWIAWSQTSDATGRVCTDVTTFASAIATTAGIDPSTDVVAPMSTDPQIDVDHRYSYDKAGALVKVEDLTGLPAAGAAVSPYTMREYTFTTNGARETLTEQIHADGTTAGPATAGVQQKLSYDSADRPTGGYVYDEFGRQKTLPAAHAPNPSAGDVQLGYFDTDLPASITQGATSTSFTLDIAARRLVQTSTTDGKTSTATRHYTDGSDNPAWIETVAPDGTKASTRYTASISGSLGASIADDGAVSLMLPNIHGDIVTTIPIIATAKSADPATTITGWAAYTEYGTPIDAAQTKTVGTVAGYEWLGAKERSTTDGSAGLTLMGARLYNAATGAFTSTDPEPGGNLTAYTYPIDPINMYDLDGRKGWWKKHGRTVAKFAVAGLAIGGALACGASVVCAIGAGAVAGFGTYAAANAGSKRWSWKGAAKSTVLGAALGAGWGGATRAIGWRLTSKFRFGIRFSHKATARGTDFAYKGTRVFGIHSHRIAGQSRAKFVHYHRRPGIKHHRPWQKGW